ncbi:MAG TPA: NrfD/PsrC family molybdoenzyme membrane anchor subunit [Saprospiraceae bacterium]|nr:NrfD/PsrC family molybdoenzyme membrane anchor subunit [Saprospiraceae bacterium]
MKTSDVGYDVLKAFSPQLERTSTREKIWIGFLLAMMAFGMYALYLQIAQGHGVTGMRDYVVWGVYISNFMFLIGLSYAGALIAGLLFLAQVEWGRPLFRLAQMMTIASVIVGPLFILLCVGRLDRLHHLFIYPRLQSPMIWDVVAVVTFLTGSVLFLYLSLIRDFALYSQSDLKLSNWKRKLYRVLSLGYNDIEEQRRALMMSLNLLSLVLIPLSVIVASILSWIFGMTLRPGWHSTIFGPYFVLGAIYSGSAALILIMWVYRKIYKLENFITDTHFRYIGYFMLLFAAGYGYFTFSEYFTSWYGSEKWDGELIEKLFSAHQYGWYTFFAHAVGILVPVMVVAVPALRKTGLIVFAALIAVVAMWIKRYLIVVPTLETPLLPMQDIRSDYVNYSITWVEWGLTLAGIALFLLLFTLAGKFMTIMPVTGWPRRQTTQSDQKS